MFEFLVVAAFFSGQGVSGAAGCQQIKDDAERLACFDSIFGHKGDEPAVPDMVESPQEVTPAAQDFGLTEAQRSQKKKSPEPVIEMIESRIAVAERHPRDDRFTLTLENGQKWVQIDPTPMQRFHVGDAITIHKAAFNSYLARGPNSGSGVRVRRLE